jgi:hypothetical protein
MLTRTNATNVFVLTITLTLAFNSKLIAQEIEPQQIEIPSSNPLTVTSPELGPVEIERFDQGVKIDIPQDVTPSIEGNSVVLRRNVPLAAQTPITEDKADRECEVAQLKCAQFECFPLAERWDSYEACLSTECKVKKQNCLEALVEMIKERRRE